MREKRKGTQRRRETEQEWPGRVHTGRHGRRWGEKDTEEKRESIRRDEAAVAVAGRERREPPELRIYVVYVKYRGLDRDLYSR